MSKQLRASNMHYSSCFIAMIATEMHWQETKEKENDENGSPEEDKVQLHGCFKACYQHLLHQTVKSKLCKLGEMAEDLQDEAICQ